MSDYVPGLLDGRAPLCVAGHRGLVGSAIWRKLASGFHGGG
jgi:GDP-L-fucose synthase